MEYSRKNRMLRVLLCVLLAHLLRIPISSNALSVRLVNGGQDNCSNASSTPSISSYNPAVLPGENVQIRCSRSSQRCTNVNFHWYKNKVKIQTTNSSALTLFNMAASQQGLYRCTYSYPETIIESPLSGNITISMVSLKQPNISLISEEEGGASCPPNPQGSKGTVRPHTLEVTKGHKFSIVCSSEPQGYTGGSFRLLLSGSNQTWREPAQHHWAQHHSAQDHWAQHHWAQHHWACFLFHQANDSHRGNYSCVYEVTVGSRLFNSTPSELLTVTVKVSWLLYLLAAGGLVLLLLLLLSIFLVWRCCLGNRRKKASLNAGNPEGGVTYWRNEPVEDDERDYESVDDEDDEDKEDYVNTETLGVKAESLQEEEDYVNTETLGVKAESLQEEEDYVNTESLGGGVEDYERMDNYTEHSDREDYERMAHHTGHSDGEDYVNVDPLSAGISI
ncbi:uncharacterized protein LOC143123911 isoform X2 [Alosa pseudoharengus]|uniref:uncharacterized protein LOC143123911 isoform X2 n=1 Tax=Alosa pseudoharengus TaxID=34774 RepID=UPI003F892162